MESTLKYASRFQPAATIKPGSISGAKFYDANVNGVWDSGEPPIGGWKVHLTGTNIRGDTVDEYALTDDSGKFVFEDLLPGTYTVEEVFPSGTWTWLTRRLHHSAMNLKKAKTLLALTLETSA
jgi:protocatechuate 3,4-dioxygenase beta subunit